MIFDPDVTLADIKQLCSNRIRSYSETKLDRIAEGYLPQAEVECGDPHTLEEIANKVQAGLEEARRVANGSPHLLQAVDDLESLWRGSRDQFIVLSVGLHSLSYRDDAQILGQLSQYHQQLSDSWTIDGVVGNA